MKVWNHENEYDLTTPSGSVYRISVHALPKGFEEHFSIYDADNNRVFFNDCWIDIQRIHRREETKEHENVG